MPQSNTRLLTIGEFAAATQLSLKALRIYDDAKILPPAEVDAANGYRYYRREQIANGRLIRTLREMDVPLTDTARIVTAPREQVGAMLGRCAQEVDLRYARQKRAFQAGLASLRKLPASAAPEIRRRRRASTTAAVFAATATRDTWLSRFRLECAGVQRKLDSVAQPLCFFCEPLSDEESRIEIVCPTASVPMGVASRSSPEANCVVHEIQAIDADAPRIEAALDAMFDWLDRHGLVACEPPSISFVGEDRAELSWAYEFVSKAEQRS